MDTVLLLALAAALFVVGRLGIARMTVLTNEHLSSKGLDEADLRHLPGGKRPTKPRFRSARTSRSLGWCVSRRFYRAC